MKLRGLKIAIIFVLLLSLIPGCRLQKQQGWPDANQPNVWPTEVWIASTPEEQGMDSGKLLEMLNTIEKQHIRLHSLLIIRNGYLVLEAYGEPYGPDNVHAVESNTKSVIASLIGIALDQGKIRSTDQRVLELLPNQTVDLSDDRKKDIRLKDLLSMTPGLDCQDQTPPALGMYDSQDWDQYLLELPMTAEPGKEWIYCSGAAHLLSAILAQSTGMQAREYANKYLFQPLGIPEVPSEDWESDPEGITNGISGLYLTPRDLAKFGYLYLHKGSWNGQQIVPAEWVKESTHEQAYIGPDPYVGGLDRRFGYMWSIFPHQSMYGYLGMAGQELFVIPEKNMVVVFTGSLEVGKELMFLQLVNEYIASAAQSSTPLPARPDYQEQLQAWIGAASGQTLPVPALPDLALGISGSTYHFEQNSLGWEAIGFTFQEGSSDAILRISDSPDLPVGLDNRFRLTDTSGGRPIGLRGRWEADGKFFLTYITFGDIVTSHAWFRFQADEVRVTIQPLNFPGQPVTITGRRP
jgi:CubicO group peptidase (beta-lactamase class C family)